MSDKTFLRLEISKQLKKDLKIIATQKETTMTKIVNEIITDYVKKINNHRKIYN